VAGPIRIAILANAAQARREMSSTGDAAQGMGSKITSTGKRLAAGFAVGAAVAGAAALKLGAASVKSASDAQQSLGATETVFGRYAGTVITQSKRAAREVGLSANEYRELANVMGASLNGAGIPLKKTAALTSDINKRAADMAATFGGTTRNAVEAIGSLMRGEADPIEQYGVSIKQSDVSARLAAQGLDGLTGSALKQAEMQARLDLLMQKTNKTQGAFKRESGTLANQQQVLGAQFENLKAKIGTALLPILTTFVAFLNTSILPAVERMLPGLRAWGSEMSDRLGPIVSRVSGFITGTLAPALSSLAGYVVGTVVPAVLSLYGKVATNLAPVLTALVGHVQRIVAKFREWQPSITVIVTAVAKVTGKVIEFASAILGRVLPPMIRFASSLTVGLIGAIIATIATIVRIVAKVIDFGGAVIDGGRKVGEFAGRVRDRIGDVVGYFTDLPGKITAALSGAKTMLVETGKNIIRGLLAGLDAAKQWVIDKVQEIADVVPGWVKKRLGIASPSKVTAYLGRMAGQGLADGIASMRGKVGDAADKTAQRIVERIQQRIDAAKGLRDSITSMRDSIAGALTGDLFGGRDDESGTALDKFRAQLESARALAERVRAATQTLIGKGVSSAFLQKLAASGNTDLIVQLSGAADAASLAKSYEAVLATNAESGLLVAEQVIGTRLDTVATTLRELRADMRAERERAREERRKPVAVRFTADQIDQLSRGRAIRADLDAWDGVGGRRSA
jgi:phage-related protein